MGCAPVSETSVRLMQLAGPQLNSSRAEERIGCVLAETQTAHLAAPSFGATCSEKNWTGMDSVLILSTPKLKIDPLAQL